MLRLRAGPDAGRSIPLVGGPVVLGRAAGPGRVDDPFLEAHHLLVRLTRVGVDCVQLSGRVPARVDGAPIGDAAVANVGSTIELGATRVTVASRGEGRWSRAESSGGVVVGVGVASVPADDVRSFVELAAVERSQPAEDVTLDLGTLRRLLVVGPGAMGLVRAVLEQANDRRIRVAEPDRIARPPGRHDAVVAHHPDPDASWPDDELPPDAALISVGVLWQAVLLVRTSGGDASLRRFHAAGRPRSSPGAHPGDRRAHGRTGRSSLSR